MDGSGLWLSAKRLERGRFSWPSVSSENETKVLLSYEELALLVGGIDLSRTRRKVWYRREESGDKKAALIKFLGESAVRLKTVEEKLHHAQLENRYLRELLRLARIEKYGPGS